MSACRRRHRRPCIPDALVGQSDVTVAPVLRKKGIGKKIPYLWYPIESSCNLCGANLLSATSTVSLVTIVRVAYARDGGYEFFPFFFFSRGTLASRSRSSWIWAGARARFLHRNFMSADDPGSPDTIESRSCFACNVARSGTRQEREKSING